jgi:integrase
MKRTKRLMPLQVTRLREPGISPDGDGLYLQVTLGTDGGINKSWLYRFTAPGGRERYMGLGPVRKIPLALARQKATEAFQLRHEGKDPIEERKARKAAAALASAKLTTFDECADAYITSHCAGWHSVRYADRWTRTLAAYVSPVLGRLSVQDVDTGLVLKVLRPLWVTKPEAVRQIRGRIEKVLDYATASGYRQGENPARWRGHLENLLPERSRVHAVEHRPALPYAEVAAFLAALRQRDDVPAAALEFMALTAVRPSEARLAKWDEIDFQARIWTVPAARMKGKKGQRREHRVPLSAAAIAVLRRMERLRQDDRVFPPARGAALSDRAFRRLFERMGRADAVAVTAHGFRSTFRDWAGEQTNFAREVCEMALAHSIRDQTEAAYQRGDLFDKRRKLMDAWAVYCARPAAKPAATERKVVPLRG